MRVESRYVCETCGVWYRSERMALACEATVLSQCPVKVGDEVMVSQRYGAPETDVVTSVSVVGGGAGYLASELPDGHPTVERLVSGTGAQRLHRWAIRVGRRHQLGKDENTYTDEVGLDDLVLDDRSVAMAG